jgi:hypothetical protein
MLNGATGDMYGNAGVHMFDSGWQTQMNSEGALEMAFFNKLKNAIPWWTLTPDQSGTVFQSVGSTQNYSGAYTADGTLALAYKPSTGTGSQSFTVNMSRFAGAVTAQWYDPTNGSYTTIGTGLANSGTMTFTSPATNSVGKNDFVLVLQAAPPTQPPSPPTGLAAVAGNAQVTLSWNVTATATSYNVFRSTTGGGANYTQVASGVTATTYTDKGLTNGTKYFYEASAVNGIGQSGKSSEVSATPLVTAGPIIAIDAGGPAAGNFVAETDVTTGTSDTGSVTNTIDTSAVTNPAPQAVYQTWRSGTFSFTVPNLTANTPYLVRLHFSENLATAPGVRVFNVALNGTQVLTNFDIFVAAGGQFKALVKEFTVNATSSGQVTIGITTVTGNGRLNGFEIYAAGTVAAPTVAGVSPSSGSTAGGTAVTITGTNFTGATAVSFGGVAATSFTVNSATQITATAPAEAAGTVDVKVTTAGGTSAAVAADHFTYVTPVPTITGISPTSGSTAGGTIVTITGSNFTGATAVSFGSVAATSFTVNSATQITATAPAEAAGSVDVKVTTAGGTSATVSADQFTYKTSTLTPVIAIDAGGPAAGNFVADTDFSQATPDTASVTNTIDTSGVTNPAPQSVYQSWRSGTFSYSIPNLTAGSQYLVRLHFSENWVSGVGQRVFNVSINGTQVLTNFDIIAAAGAEFKAIVKEFTVAADGTGHITIGVTTVVGNGRINGIEILAVSPEMLAGTPRTASHVATLTQTQLDRVVALAIADWAATGLSASQVAALKSAHFEIADLPGGLLAETAGNEIIIDSNAAGYGWSLGAVVAPHKVDLLTVVCHELGHLIGLGDVDTLTHPGDVMDATLTPGVRRLP